MKMIGFDLETTGVDVETARPVAIALVERHQSGDDPWVGLVTQNEPIPAEATAVHGIPTWIANRYGDDERYLVQTTVDRLWWAVQHERTPLVGMNIAFDLTILDRRATALGIPTLCYRLGHCPRPVLDVMVLDHMADPYRKGRRTLTHLCQHYGVDLADAHNPVADVTACLDLVALPALKVMNGVNAHVAQQEAHQRRMRALRGFFRRQGRTDSKVDLCWPVCHGPDFHEPDPVPASAAPVVASGWDAVR